MASPSERDARSISESLFAEILVSAGDEERRFRELCAQRPELAGELDLLWSDWLRCRSTERAGLPRPMLPDGPSSSSSPADGPPEVAGYECRSRIGRGGMGEVWEALDLKLGRSVALKLLPAGFLASDVARERFRREALAAGRVSHPGLVAVFAAGEQAGRPWIAQELVPGSRTLRDRIEELRRADEIPPAHEGDMAVLFAQIAEALEIAHRAGVVHRDLKPQNILITREGAPKVADFGLARLAGEASLSLTGEFLGTWLYASPEHLSGRGGIDAQSDVFCLGATLYECLTLQRPFRGETGPEISHAILHLDPLEPEKVRPRVPRDLSVICMKALEKRPSQRYASMQALADDLRRFSADEAIQARPPSWPERSRRWGRHHPAQATALVLGTGALLGLTALLWRTQRALEETRVARAGEERANTELQATIGELVASRDEARSDRAVSDEVVAVLSDLFEAATPFQLGVAEPTLRELVGRGAEQLRAGVPESPRARARLLTTLGTVLNTLGDRQQAEEFLEEAVRLWRELAREGDHEARVARAGLANVRMNLGEDAAALELALPLVDLWRSGDLEPGIAGGVLTDVGLMRSAAGELAEARLILEECLALSEEHKGPGSHEAAYARSNLAGIDYRTGRFAEGLALLEGDAELLRPLLSAGNSIALDGANMRALFLLALERPAEAEQVLLEALEVAERVLGPSHPRSLNLRTNLGTVLQELGRLAEAEWLFRRSLELSVAQWGPRVEESLVAKNDLAGCLMRQGRLVEAEQLLRELVSDTEESRGSEHTNTVHARLGLGFCLWRLGRAEEAVQITEQALSAIPAGSPLRGTVEEALQGYRRDRDAAGAAPPAPP